VHLAVGETADVWCNLDLNQLLTNVSPYAVHFPALMEKKPPKQNFLTTSWKFSTTNRTIAWMLAAQLTV